MSPPGSKKQKMLQEGDAQIAHTEESLDQIIARQAREIARQAREIARIQQEYAAERMAESMLSVLPGADAAQSMPFLTCYGTISSHLRPKNQGASAVEKSFPLPDLRAMNGLLSLGLETKPSSLRNLINERAGKLPYANESDVHDIIQRGLLDATSICNKALAKLAGVNGCARPFELGVRRESVLFSNIPDHVVVFDELSGAPVFCVETKKVWGTLTDQVFGQVFDQLTEMSGRGHPHPFGALTCYDKTHIVWLENASSEDVLKDLTTLGCDKDRLKRIVSRLPGANDSTATDTPDLIQCTQSPVKEKAALPVDFVQHSRFVERQARGVLHSGSFAPSEMVAAFVTAILCSLDGFQNPREIWSFQPKQKVRVQVLCMDENSYKWGTLETTYQGPLEGPPPTTLYVVDHLGTGSTSKVYRALTLDGFDCVVKMYVKRRGDDKRLLESDDFDKVAKAAVEREVQAYQQIYGAKLEKYVWQQTLNGLHCVILPYFEHPDSSSRIELVPQIRKILNDNFVKREKIFFESDQSWRHVGWFNNDLYLFDLADLETLTGSPEDAVDSHINRLLDRFP